MVICPDEAIEASELVELRSVTILSGVVILTFNSHFHALLADPAVPSIVKLAKYTPANRTRPTAY